MGSIARAGLLFIALALALAPARLAEAEGVPDLPAAEPSAEALAQAWISQSFGGALLEIWQTEWAGDVLSYGVARQWAAGRPEIFLHILAPRAYEELNFLLRERDEKRFEILYYRTPKLFPAGQKAARVMPVAKPGPLERLPFAPGLPAIADLVPPDATDYAWTRLADVRIQSADCRVIAGRPRRDDLGFDRVEISIARATGVALDTQWFRGAERVRHVTTRPADVRDEAGRFLPTRRSVEQPGQDTQIFVLLRLMIDPVFPEQQFTTQNLKTGRFPTY